MPPASSSSSSPSKTQDTTTTAGRNPLSALLCAAYVTAIGTIAYAGTLRMGMSPSRAEVLNDLVGKNPHRKRPAFLDRTPPRFERTRHTFNTFVVADGIDLAGFGLDNDKDALVEQLSKRYREREFHHRQKHSFELFEDFDLTRELKGNETWIELLEYRRDATHPSLSFYVDKVAFKRWLVTSYADLKIEGPKTFLLRYGSELRAEVELVQSASRTLRGASNISSSLSGEAVPSLVANELLRWLPTDTDYAAKPTHLSCSGGVWLVHNDDATNTTYVGNGKKTMKAYTGGIDVGGGSTNDIRREIVGDLSRSLQIVQEKCGRTVVESYALRHVQPGVVVEERFTQPPGESGAATGDDTGDDKESKLKGGMEFKVFTIWGRAWLTVWRPGMDGVRALFFRNGTSLVYEKKKSKKTEGKPHETVELPTWVDWDKVISMGETLGRHKDMFRTDIFVGVASGSNDVRYVVSETEIHPTPLRGFETVFEEAGRLWLAGYYYRLPQRVIPNTEVPWDFRHGS